MALKAASYHNFVATVEIPLPDWETTLTVQYYPYRITGNPFLLMEVVSANPAAWLAATLASWDILGPDDVPLPTTVEVVRQLPMLLLTMIIGAISTDYAKRAPAAQPAPPSNVYELPDL
jgi:hypothetical protein